MDKTRIDWCDSTWNPVTGCLHGCEYCYARGIAERFGGFDPSVNGAWNTVLYEKGGERLGELNQRQKRRQKDGKMASAPYPFGFVPTLHRYRLNDYIGKKGRSIFVCSMADLFGKWVPDGWIEEVLAACSLAPQHNYLFLTKNPGRYVDLQDSGKLIAEDNMWYGASAANCKQLELAGRSFSELKTGVKNFFSVEPILEDITASETWSDCMSSRYADWVIVGAETGRRSDRVIPEYGWIRNIANDCGKEDIPVFMKSSLAQIWGGPLTQEVPKEINKPKATNHR